MTTNLPNTMTSDITNPESPKPLISDRLVIWILVGAAVLGLLFVGLSVYLAFAFPERIEALRDVIIMLFAMVSCMAVIVLVILLMAIIRLINMLELEIKPILEQTNQTIQVVRGTTTYVGNHVVRPVIQATSFVAGVRRGVRTLLGNPKRNLPK